MNVLVLKKYEEDVLSVMRDVFPHDWNIISENPSDAAEAIKKADILIPSHSRVDENILSGAGKLKIIQTGAGYDNVDLDLCREKGIRVFNAPSVNTGEVAEHAFAFIFNWFKKISILDSDIKKRGWSLRKEGRALSDLSIGIIGYGNIGKRVSEIADVFGMNIFIYSEHEKNCSPDNTCFTETLDQLLKQSDIVTLHTSGGKNKNNMISDREFSLMKEGAFFINTARGSLVDEDALCRALDRGKISGAGLDVFQTEPLPSDSRLRNYSNIIMTPHNAGEPDFYRSYRKRFSFFSRNILKALEGGEPDGVIV